MRSRWWLAALLAVVTLAAGCAVTVGGTAQPAPNATPRSLRGRTIKRVLLGKTVLSRIVKQPLEIDPRFPPLFGGPETLQGGMPGWPVDCIGVAVMMQQSVYQSSDVQDVAVETWRPTVMSAGVTRVKEGVVSLPTAADSQCPVREILPTVAEMRWQDDAVAGRGVRAQGQGHPGTSHQFCSRGDYFDRVERARHRFGIHSSRTGHWCAGQLPHRGRGRLS